MAGVLPLGPRAPTSGLFHNFGEMGMWDDTMKMYTLWNGSFPATSPSGQYQTYAHYFARAKDSTTNAVCTAVDSTGVRCYLTKGYTPLSNISQTSFSNAVKHLRTAHPGLIVPTDWEAVKIDPTTLKSSVRMRGWGEGEPLKFF
jgi:hypothetical protein